MGTLFQIKTSSHLNSFLQSWHLKPNILMPLPSWLKSGYFPKYVHPFDSVTEFNIYMEKNVQICIPTNNSFCFANKYLLNSVNSPNICTVVLLIGNMTWHLRMTIIERYHRSLYIKHLWHTKGTLKATVRKQFVWGLTSLFSSTSSYYTPIKKDHSNPLHTEGGETSTYSEIDLSAWEKLICCTSKLIKTTY